MKIAILSRKESLYSTTRLKEAAEKRDHQVSVLNPLKFAIHVEKGNPELLYDKKPIDSFDAIIPRIGASITLFGTAVVRQFEQMGVYCLNTSLAISVSRDKLRAIQILSRHNVGFPITQFVKDREMILPAIEDVGGAPVVIKLLEGTQGIGVILADSQKIAEAIVETFQSTKQNVLIQKFVAESKGQDIRAFVVGDKVVAAMKRQSKGDEFRSNVHRGGSVEKIELDSNYIQSAVHAAQIMGLNVAGVDMLVGSDGPKLMEVNSSPGLEGIEKASGVDVAGAIIKFIEDQVLFPDIDIRQRLTLKSGYGVVEIPIGNESDLKGKTIKGSELRQKDIVVMSIIRGSVTIPNPRGEREILSGDKLLCFGKLETLKTLIPKKYQKQPPHS